MHEEKHFEKCVLCDCITTPSKYPVCCTTKDNHIKVRIKKCNHVYHEHCITVWKKHRDVCPLCNCEYELTDLEIVENTKLTKIDDFP
jgi:hypothetical protein